MELVLDALLDALIDSAKMAPLLFVIYAVIEAIGLKFGAERMGIAMAQAGKAGPAVGALAGVVPQCGFSLIATALYNQRFVTIGTLFAVYIATSDEAIPVILSQPDAIGLLVPLIGVKLAAAIVVGYGLDVVFRERNKQVFAAAEDEDDAGYDEDETVNGTDAALGDETISGGGVASEDGALAEGETADGTGGAIEPGMSCGCGCCEPGLTGWRLYLQTLVVSPLVHTLQVWVFIFLTSFAIALLFGVVGQDTIADALKGSTLLQPVLAALVGLIPNCAASVAITEFYLEGVITFGATVAGLCASGGLGILLLIKEGDRREAVAIIAGLFAVSVVVGLVVQVIGLI